MRVLLVGAAGTLGTAVHQMLVERGHDVVTVGRGSGDLRYDVADPAQVSALYAAAGDLDAVACAAGDVPYESLADITSQAYQAAFAGKVLSQIELVRQGVPRVAERGSFTLITGVTAREPIPTGTAASMANGAVEAFVRAAAIEVAPQRINAISPSVFTENQVKYDQFFPGFPPVDLAHVAQAYLRSIEGAQTGQIHLLP